MSSQGFWPSLRLGRRLLTATRLVYELSSVVVKPIKCLIASKKQEEKKEEPGSTSRGTRFLEAPIIVVDYLDRLYLPLYYGATLVTASSFYYSAYRLFGPLLNKGAFALFKMAAAHPYSIGLSLLLLSDFPVVLIGKGIALVLTKAGQWALRKVGMPLLSV